MCLLCKQLSHILVLLHRKWLNLYAYVTNGEICYLYCKRVISIVFKIYICESKWFIVLFHRVLESEFLNHEPNTGWLNQVYTFWLLFQIRSMIIHFNLRHTYGRLSEKIVAELIMPNV